MKRTLIVATTSYAGMGPYVSEIVNSFSLSEDVFYLFLEDECRFFSSNVRESLFPKSSFYYQKNSKINKLRIMFLNGNNAFSRKIIEIVDQQEIEVVHFINFYSNLFLLNVLKEKGVSVLQTVHDLHPHEANKAFYKVFRMKIMAKKMSKAINVSDNLSTNSYLQLKELECLFPDKNIYYYGFPSLVSKQVQSGVLFPSELSQIKNKYILFFGRIEEYKGIRYLYDSFVKSDYLANNYYLVIAGKGELLLDNKTDLRDKHIIFLNRYIKDEEIAELYKNAACVVYPYISATQSGVLSLSCYFNVPTLVSDIPYFNSIVEKAKIAITFKNKDSEDLQFQMINLLKSDHKDMLKNQQDFYKNNYCPQVIHDQLIGIYDSLRKDTKDE